MSLRLVRETENKCKVEVHTNLRHEISKPHRLAQIVRFSYNFHVVHALPSLEGRGSETRSTFNPCIGRRPGANTSLHGVTTSFLYILLEPCHRAKRQHRTERGSWGSSRTSPPHLSLPSCSPF